MLLAELGRDCLEVPDGLGSLAVGGVVCDSRAVRAGDLFVAVPGESADGHRFVRQAEQRGAIAVVGELPADDALVSQLAVPYLQVPNARRALGWLSAQAHGLSARGLVLAGVTGTKGKTTTTWVLDSIFRRRPLPAALMGTVHNRVGDRLYPAGNTTPSCVEIHSLLQELANCGGRFAALEVSSHGIVQERLAGLDFDCAVFTNLAPEHLDYHKDLASYRAAKGMFFEALKPEAWAVLPRNDPTADDYADRTAAQIIRYSPRSVDGVENVSTDATGTSFRWRGRTVHTSLWGEHNLANVLAAMTAASCLGFSDAEIADGVERAAAPPGRLEEIAHPGDFRVFVDYAHTDGALETVLRAVRTVTRRRVIVVFGCGGDRDRTKRPRMGRVAAELADVVVVTSDNPRGEDPERIIDEIFAGMDTVAKTKEGTGPIREPDRRAAIARAMDAALAGDAVLIAGKGHETYQEISGQRFPFDDRLVAREILGVAGCEEEGGA